MKRKQTLLEENLIKKGYMLSHKTYCGKNSSKVDQYVYVRDNGVIFYMINIDRTREHIENYSFTNKIRLDYTNGIIESLQEIMEHFENNLKDIYDFENKVAKEWTPFEMEDDYPFVEESVFDD